MKEIIFKGLLLISLTMLFMLIILCCGLMADAILEVEETAIVETYTVEMEITSKDIIQYHGNADKQYLIAVCGSNESAVVQTNEQMFASLRVGEIVEVEITVAEKNKNFEIKG